MTEQPAGITPIIDRKRLLGAIPALGAGLLPSTALESAAAQGGESVQQIVDLALAAERLAVTIYHTALTSRPILADRRMAGGAANINAVAADGDAGNVAYLQAALSQEQQHARLLAAVGARSPYNAFYFPVNTFKALGHTRAPGSFLWVVDHLETTFIGAYMAAIRRFGALERTDLAVLSARILGVECEHRALYRVVAGDTPANNLTLEVASFGAVGEAVRVLQPYLTGKGFPSGATRAIPLPSDARIARVVGTHSSS